MCVSSCAVLADEALTALEAKTKEMEALQGDITSKTSELEHLRAELEKESQHVASLCDQAGFPPYLGFASRTRATPQGI
jgi:short-subunit dehydrogenase